MKIKAIISIMIVCILMMTSVAVFADIPIPAIPSDGYNYWIVYSDVVQGKTRIRLVKSTNPIEANDTGTHLFANPCRWYDLVDNSWQYYYEGNGVTLSYEHLYASNHNIPYRNGSGFFFTLPSQSELYLTMKMMDFGAILRTFSAGLIPLVGLIVSAICLAKGLAYLRNQLMR